MILPILLVEDESSGFARCQINEIRDAALQKPDPRPSQFWTAYSWQSIPQSATRLSYFQHRKRAKSCQRAPAQRLIPISHFSLSLFQRFTGGTRFCMSWTHESAPLRSDPQSFHCHLFRFSITDGSTYLPCPMPPKLDPYASPLHRRIDTLLWIFSMVLAAIVFSFAAHWRNALAREFFVLC